MRVTFVLWGLLTASAAPAWAQGVATPPVVPTPSELAGQRDPRLPTDPPPPPEQRPAPRELARMDDELRLDIKGYTLDEETPAALREALPRLTAAYTGVGRSYEDLVLAANELTRFMQRDLGYYLGYAYIPEQVPGDDGTVRIAVLEGRLDRALLNWREGLPVRREVLQAYLDRLQPGAVLTVKDVERVVFLLNDLRGVLVRTEVKPGSRPGTAILEFTPRADPRLSYKVDGDLNGSRYIGAARVGAGLMWNSPLGRGDGLTVSALSSSTGGLRFGLLGYSTPVGADGLKTGLSVSALRYELDPDEFPLGLDGKGLTVNAFGLYPWLRSRNLNLFALLALDGKRYEDRISSVTTRKRVDDLVLGLTGDFRDSVALGGVNTFELNFSTGRLHYPDGRPSGLDDAARFGKLSYAFARLQNILDGRLLAYLSLRGQQALRNLDTTEQFRAGGPDGVRAFGPGDGTGDGGLLASAELRWLPPERWFGRWARELVMGVFVDAAQVRLRHDPTLVSRAADYVNRERLAGVGVSLVWARPGAYGLRMSLATPTTGESSSDARDTRLYLQGSWVY